MKIGSRIILILFIVFIVGITLWALFSPKEEISERIYRTIKEQEKRADLSFKAVTFEEVAAGVKYWELGAESAALNKSTGIATLKNAQGNFFKSGKAALRFKSPAALWDMKKKEIFLDRPIGYDVKLEGKILSLIENLKKSIFNLPQVYQKGSAYWFQAANLTWRLADEKLFCTGGIILNKGEVTGHADNLQGDVGLETVLIEGNPKIVISLNETSPITIEADAFTVISDTDTILAKGNPKVCWKDAKIFADEIKYQQRDNVIILTGKVIIDYRDIHARGDTARYLTVKEAVLLEGSAHAVQGENKLSGERVNVSLKDKKISVLGKGKVIITEEELK